VSSARRAGRGSISHRPISAFSAASSFLSERASSNVKMDEEGALDDDDEDHELSEKRSGKVNWEAVARAEHKIFTSAALKMETALAELNLLGGLPSFEDGAPTQSGDFPNQFRTAVCCRILDSLADSMSPKHRHLYKRIAQELLFSIYSAYPRPGSAAADLDAAAPFRFDLVPYYSKWQAPPRPRVCSARARVCPTRARVCPTRVRVCPTRAPVRLTLARWGGGGDRRCTTSSRCARGSATRLARGALSTSRASRR